MFDYKNDPTLRALEGLLSTDNDWDSLDDNDWDLADEGFSDLGDKFKNFVAAVKTRTKAAKDAYRLTSDEKAAIGNMKPMEAAQQYLATVSDMGADTMVKQFLSWAKTEEAKRSGVTVKGFSYNGKQCALMSTNANSGTIFQAIGFGPDMVLVLIFPAKSGAKPGTRTINIYNAAKRAAGKAKRKARRDARKNPDANVAVASEALQDASTAEEFIQAMESLTESVQDSISYAMEAFTKDNLDSALDAFGKMVDEKCTTVSESEEMASAIAGSSEKYNALLAAMKDGIEKADTGMIDKETLGQVLSTAGSELKMLCTDCGLTGVSADNELSDDDITNLRALLLGAKQIVDQKTVTLGGGSDQPTGPDGDPASESLFDGLISFGDPAEEGLGSWIGKHIGKKKKTSDDAADEGDDDDDEDAEEGLKSWYAARKAKRAAKKAAPADESDVFTFPFDDDDYAMESLFDQCLGDIAMESDGSSDDATVAAVKKGIFARIREERAKKKQIKSDVRGLDMLTLVKEYMAKKIDEGLSLGTGSLLRKLEDDMKDKGMSLREYRVNGKMVLICKDGSDEFVMYEVVTNKGKKAAVRTVFKSGLAKSVSKKRIGSSKATESIEDLYAFLENSQIATEGDLCCADGNEATILAQKKIAEMDFEIDDDGYTILINSPDEA